MATCGCTGAGESLLDQGWWPWQWRAPWQDEPYAEEPYWHPRFHPVPTEPVFPEPEFITLPLAEGLEGPGPNAAGEPVPVGPGREVLPGPMRPAAVYPGGGWLFAVREKGYVRPPASAGSVPRISISQQPPADLRRMR